MTIVSIGGSVLLAITSFIAGWLTATEKTRTEVYKKRLDIYLQINRLAASLVHFSLKNSVESSVYFGPMVKARLDLGECFISNAILISQEVGGLITKLVEAKKEPDLEEVRVTFNFLCQQMAKDLKLKHIHLVNESLLQMAPQRTTL